MATVDQVLDDIRSVVNDVGNYISNLVTQLNDFLSGLVDTVVSYISDVVASIVNTVELVFLELRDAISGIFNRIITDINNFISEAVSYVSNLIDQVVTFISGLVDSAVGIFNDIYNAVVDSVSDLFNSTVSLFNDIVDAVVLNIADIVNDVKQYFSDLFDVVASGVSQVIEQAGAVVGSIKQAIEDFITSVVDVVGNSLRDLLETIASLPDTISELANRLVESAAENIGIPLKDIPQSLIDNVVKTVKDEGIPESDMPTAETMAMIFGDSPVTRSPDELRQRISDTVGAGTVASWVIRTIFIPLSLINIMGGIMSANAQIVLQEHARINPYRMLDPIDIVSAYRYNLLNEDEAVDIFKRHGYTENDATRQLIISEQHPPAGELVDWFLRGLINDEQFTESLTKQGWAADSIERLKTAARFIPPVGDLISMAVREAFSPDIAERFGQYEGYPDELTEFAGQQGLTEDWARRYWAAHWALPSVQMGFEMLHRDVIGMDDLELLLRASDVMPFWRDKLIEISYSPLTRVDVRRMHKLGVIDETQVFRAYKDIGYNDVNAQRLTDFTVAYNDDSSTEDDAALSDLTRANIVNFYEDGVIDRAEAMELLLLIGITPESAELFLTTVDINAQRQERKQAIDLVIAQAKAGSITFEQAQDTLSGMGLETAEREKALADLQRLQATQTKIPSKSDLDKFLQAGIIEAPEYLDMMGRIGYSELWAQRYLQLIRGG